MCTVEFASRPVLHTPPVVVSSERSGHLFQSTIIADCIVYPDSIDSQEVVG